MVVVRDLKSLLLDIEGTTSSISFVHDVMFPLVRERLATFLERHWEDGSLTTALEQIEADRIGRESLRAAGGNARKFFRERVIREVQEQMDEDRKATGLKRLQGMIWREAFVAGELKSHVYPDVPPALIDWHSRGLELRIYSSGSVESQRLFFGHTVAGDLLPYFCGFYDTTIGAKKDPASYDKIAADIGCEARQIVFISDLPGELQAARAAGFQVVLSIRPGNSAVPGQDFPQIASFAELHCL